MAPENITDRDWALWRAFALMGRRLASELDRGLMADAGISSAEFEILHALSLSDGGEARARELADMLSWEKSRLSHLVTRMVTRGFLERSQCETDLRGTWVTLAPAGREALDAALPGFVATLQSSFTSMVSDEDARTLTRTAIDVVEGMHADSCQTEIGAIAQASGLSAADAASRAR
jgi:DNA-binding MarR family transcriptional regulator